MKLSEAQEGDEVVIRLKCNGTGRYSNAIRLLETDGGYEFLLSSDTEVEEVIKNGQ